MLMYLIFTLPSTKYCVVTLAKSACVYSEDVLQMSKVISSAGHDWAKRPERLKMAKGE